MYVPRTSRPAEAVLSDTGVGLSLLQARGGSTSGSKSWINHGNGTEYFVPSLPRPMPSRWKCCRGQLGRRRKLPTELGSSCPPQIEEAGSILFLSLGRTSWNQFTGHCPIISEVSEASRPSTILATKKTSLFHPAPHGQSLRQADHRRISPSPQAHDARLMSIVPNRDGEERH